MDSVNVQIVRPYSRVKREEAPACGTFDVRTPNGLGVVGCVIGTAVPTQSLIFEGLRGSANTADLTNKLKKQHHVHGRAISIFLFKKIEFICKFDIF